MFATIEPIFMAKTIGFLENFQSSGIFSLQEFLTFLGLWIAFIVINMALNFFRRYYIADMVGLRFHNHVAKKYSANLFSMSMSDYLGKKTGSIYKDYDRGASAFFSLTFFFFNSFVPTIASFFFALAILLYFNAKMTALALCMLPFMAISGYFISKKTSAPQRENNKLWTKAFGHIGNFFSNMQLGKILRLETDFRRKFAFEVDNALDHQRYISRWWSISDMITTVFVMISRFLVIGFGVYLITKGEFTVAGLILFFSYIEKIYYPLSTLFGSFPNVQKWNSDIEEFFKIFQDGTEERVFEGKKFIPKNGEIEFQNVNFGYSGERKIFENLSFSIQP